MVDSKENYKFDLGVKGLIIIMVSKIKNFLSLVHSSVYFQFCNVLRGKGTAVMCCSLLGC